MVKIYVVPCDSAPRSYGSAILNAGRGRLMDQSKNETARPTAGDQIGVDNEHQSPLPSQDSAIGSVPGGEADEKVGDGGLLYRPHPYPGRLIAVEGIDGSGKSTQLLLLERWLR